MFKEIYNSEDTLNIFTDASIKKFEEETVGSAGAIAVCKEGIMDMSIEILRYTTNNNSEIMAIYYGVLLAIKHKDRFKTINLFSDSKISVFGLREWIFNWINSIQVESNNIKDYIQGYNPYLLIGSTNQPVMNQSEIMMVIQTILANNIAINIYHQRGHINENSEESIKEAQASFIKNNNIEIDYDDMVNISHYNNIIDKGTRAALGDSLRIPGVPYIKTEPAIDFVYNSNMDMNEYSKLLNLGSLK